MKFLYVVLLLVMTGCGGGDTDANDKNQLVAKPLAASVIPGLAHVPDVG